MPVLISNSRPVMIVLSLNSSMLFFPVIIITLLFISIP
jgi:hypothetical protein